MAMEVSSVRALLWRSRGERRERVCSVACSAVGRAHCVATEARTGGARMDARRNEIAVMAHARMSAHTYVTHYLRTIRAAALDDRSA